jgi:hypothetical protein
VARERAPHRPLEAHPILLNGGRAAFTEIIRCVDEARQSVEVRAFLWRDDEIGNDASAECGSRGNDGFGSDVGRSNVLFERTLDSLGNSEWQFGSHFVTAILQQTIIPPQRRTDTKPDAPRLPKVSTCIFAANLPSSA